MSIDVIKILPWKRLLIGGRRGRNIVIAGGQLVREKFVAGGFLCDQSSREWRGEGEMVWHCLLPLFL